MEAEGESPSLRSLAEEYGANYGTLRNRSSREGWEEQRREWQARISKGRIAGSEAMAVVSREAIVRSPAGAVRAVDLLLQRIEALLDDADVALSPKDLANLAAAIERAVRVQGSLKGEMLQALSVLEARGALPRAYTIAVAEAIEEMAAAFEERVERAFAACAEVEMEDV